MTPETRQRLITVGAALVALGVGLAAGRFLAPERVQTREVDRWQTLDLTTQDLTKGYTFARTVERTVWRNVVTTITPDAGTVIVDRTVEREGSQESGNVTETEARTEVVTAERERIVERTVTLRPDWRVGVLAGASLREPWLPIAGPLVLGVQVDRRIVGGLSLGVWVNTFGAAGGALTLEF